MAADAETGPGITQYPDALALTVTVLPLENGPVIELVVDVRLPDTVLNCHMKSDNEALEEALNVTVSPLQKEDFEGVMLIIGVMGADTWKGVVPAVWLLLL